MRDARESIGSRRAFLGLALWALVVGLVTVGRGAWHLAVRDELWELAVAWFGLSGAFMLWLSHRFWRAAQRRRPDAPPGPA